MSGLATHPNTLHKEMNSGEGQRKIFITWHGHTMGRGKISNSPYLQGTDINFGVKYKKNWGRGREECRMIKQSKSRESQLLIISRWSGGAWSR
jgi:hypothetical protein